jgi:hypothetical protein
MEGSKLQILDGLFIRKGGEIQFVGLWIIWRLRLYWGKRMISRWMFGAWAFSLSNWLLEDLPLRSKPIHKPINGLSTQK